MSNKAPSYMVQLPIVRLSGNYNVFDIILTSFRSTMLFIINETNRYAIIATHVIAHNAVNVYVLSGDTVYQNRFTCKKWVQNDAYLDITFKTVNVFPDICCLPSLNNIYSIVPSLVS